MTLNTNIAFVFILTVFSKLEKTQKIGYPVSIVIIFTLLFDHCPIKHWCIWSFHLQRINKMKGIQYICIYSHFTFSRMEIILFTSTITFLDLIYLLWTQIWIRNTCLSRRLNKHKSVVYIFYQFKFYQVEW